MYIVLRDFLAPAFPLNQPHLELTFSCLMNKSKGEKKLRVFTPATYCKVQRDFRPPVIRIFLNLPGGVLLNSAKSELKSKIY